MGRTADARTVGWLMDELVGLGPLQKHMDDPTVSDILVNRWDEVYVERGGRLQPTSTRFRDQAHLEQVIQKIVALVGREISVEKPLVDARMSDGSRANAVYAPVGGPTLCIRKFNHLKLDLAPSGGSRPDWVSAGGLSREMAEFIRAMARCRANVLISGATGAGKSTLLRSLVERVPARGARGDHRGHRRAGARHAALGQARVRPQQEPWRARHRRAPPRRRRPGAERAADASRPPDHRRDPPQQGGVPHAGGAQHRPRRLGHHHPRQRLRGRPGAAGAAGHQRLPDAWRPARSAATSRESSTSWSMSRACAAGSAASPR